MKRTFAVFLAIALMAAVPLAAASQDHSGHGKKKAHEPHSHVDSSHAHDDMITIGEQSLADVEGVALINDIRAAMSKMKVKMPETHHFIMLFSNGDGSIETGTAALRITDPAGNEGETIRLVAMNGHFGADVVLSQKGEYLFKVGTSLVDGKTRQFEFRHIID